MDIKDFIKSRRIELGLTLAEVAKECNVSEATVSRWESGDIENMKRSRISALAKTLKVNPIVLLDDDIDESRPDLTENIDLSIHTIAAHTDHELTEDEAEELLRFAEFLKAKRLKDK